MSVFRTIIQARVCSSFDPSFYIFCIAVFILRPAQPQLQRSVVQPHSHVRQTRSGIFTGGMKIRRVDTGGTVGTESGQKITFLIRSAYGTDTTSIQYRYGLDGTGTVPWQWQRMWQPIFRRPAGSLSSGQSASRYDTEQRFFSRLLELAALHDPYTPYAPYIPYHPYRMHVVIAVTAQPRPDSD